MVVKPVVSGRFSWRAIALFLLYFFPVVMTTANSHKQPKIGIYSYSSKSAFRLIKYRVFSVSETCNVCLIRAGVFDEDDPIELLEGYLVEKMSKNPPHSVATGLTMDALNAVLPPDWHLISQEPVTTSDSEPEPDVAAVRGKRRDYLDGHPTPNDVGMIVEVADATLGRARGVKKRIYAKAGIPVYWIVNLVERTIEVYRVPTGPAKKPDHRKKAVLGAKDTITVILDGAEVARLKVKSFLP